MKVEFIGVGEALDWENGNSSFLVHSDTKLLIDCGVAIPTLYGRRNLPLDFLDAIYFTHWHADHIFGLPLLLLDLSVRKRTKELVIIGQPGTESRSRELCSLAYQTLLPLLSFPLRFIETTSPLQFNELNLEFAKTVHTLSNYAVRITTTAGVLGFSGDGEMTEETKTLFEPCGFLVHETFYAREHMANHTSLLELTSYLRTCPTIPRVALVHLNARERRENVQQFRDDIEQCTAKLFLPTPGDIVEISR